MKHPGFLWFLPLALLPVAIHLLVVRLRRSRPWPWTWLLVPEPGRGARRSRLRELLLMATRSSAIACLILAAAGPRLGAGAQELWVDVSGSMEAHRALLSALAGREKAVFFADKVYREFPGITYFPARPELVPKGALVLSDFQATSYPRPEDFEPVVPGPPVPNAGVLEAEAEEPYPMPGSRLSLRVRLGAWGGKAERELFVLWEKRSLWAGKVVLEGEKSIDLTFRVPEGLEGLAVVLAPPDRIPGDDTLWVPVASSGPSEIHLASDNPYLRAALFPPGVRTPWREKPGAEVRVVVGPPGGGRGIAFLDSAAIARMGLRARPTGPTKIKGQRGEINRGYELLEGDPLIRDLAGRPLVVKWGDWVLVGFVPDPDSAPLVLSGDFPLLVYRLLALVGDAPELMSARVGETLEIGGEWVVGPGGREPARKRWTPRRPGLYRVLSGGREVALVAVNFPLGEGDTRRKQIGGIPPEKVLEAKEIDLAPWLFLAFGLFLLAEALLARRPSGS